MQRLFEAIVKGVETAGQSFNVYNVYHLGRLERLMGLQA